MNFPDYCNTIYLINIIIISLTVTVYIYLFIDIVSECSNIENSSPAYILSHLKFIDALCVP